MQILNVRSVKLNITKSCVEEIIKDNKIHKIIANNEITYSLGDVIPIEILNPVDNKDVYITNYTINNITKENSNYIFTESKFLTQNYFLIPCLVNSNSNHFLNPYFVNCYTSIDNKAWEDKENLLYLVYRYTPFKGFNFIDEKLVSNNNFVYKLKHDSFNIYIFKIPEYHKDIEKYASNKYKEISEEYKKKILNTFEFENFITHDAKMADWALEFSFIDKHPIFKLLVNEKLLRQEMSKEWGFNISDSFNLIEKPNLTWKMN